MKIWIVSCKDLIALGVVTCLDGEKQSLKKSAWVKLINRNGTNRLKWIISVQMILLGKHIALFENLNYHRKMMYLV